METLNQNTCIQDFYDAITAAGLLGYTLTDPKTHQHLNVSRLKGELTIRDEQGNVVGGYTENILFAFYQISTAYR